MTWRCARSGVRLTVGSMNVDRLPWFHIHPYGGRRQTRYEQHLEQITLTPRNPVEMLLGARDALLADARAVRRRTGRAPAGVLVDAKVVDDAGERMWCGDLDLTANGGALQLAADLLAQPVHVLSESQPWPCDHRGMRWCVDVPVRSFHPTAARCHPWAPLARLKRPYERVLLYPWAVSRAAADWHSLRPGGSSVCFIRFGADGESIEAGAAPAPIPRTHPGLAAAIGGLTANVVSAVNQAGLRLERAPEALPDMIARHVWHAIAQVVQDPAVRVLWTKAPTAPRAPVLDPYPGCYTARYWRRAGHAKTSVSGRACASRS